MTRMFYVCWIFVFGLSAVACTIMNTFFPELVAQLPPHKQTHALLLWLFSYGGLFGVTAVYVICNEIQSRPKGGNQG